MKKILWLFSFLLALTLLVSCNSGKAIGSGTELTDGATSPPEEETPTACELQLLNGKSTSYTIVYATEADSAASSAVNRLRQAFRDATGVTIGVEDDYLKAGATHDGDTCKILVGRTNYPASQEAFSGLRYYDYRVTAKDTYLIVAAYTEAGYDKAIQWIADEIFAKIPREGEQEGRIMLAEDYSGAIRTEYAVNSWKIAGTALGNYRIVYADEAMKSMVYDLRAELAETAGWYLDVTLDTESEAEQYEILFGETNRTESAQVDTPDYLNYTFQTVADKLVIKTGGEHSMKNILRDFVSIVSDGLDTVSLGKSYRLEGDYYDDPYKTTRPVGTDLRLMSCNIMAEFETWGGGDARPVSQRKEIFFSALDFYQPTVIGLQEFSPQWYACLEDYREIDKWGMVTFDNPNRKDGEKVFSSILYRKDVVTPVDSGMTFYSAHNNARCRCITWAIFKMNTTGQEFCFVSTHWDTTTDTGNSLIQSAELVEFVNEKSKRCPVFTTGDFNNNENSDAYKRLLSQTNSIDCKFKAKNLLNSIGSWHDYGNPTPSVNSCDHITATSGVTVLQFETLINNEQIYGSDHSWLIADIQFDG